MSSDHDLVERIRQLPHEPLVGLLCILPPWRVASERWSSRNVASIWRTWDPEVGMDAWLFRDDMGDEFVASLHGESLEHLSGRQLVVDIAKHDQCQPA